MTLDESKCEEFNCRWMKAENKAGKSTGSAKEKRVDQGIISDVAREAVMTVIYLSMPMLGISLIVGLVISVFQATTSIQEQTLTFIPKLIAILLSLIIFGTWMGKIATQFTRGLFEQILTIVK